MELSQVDTVSAAERGAFCHMRNPFTGVVMYVGPEEHVDPATGNLTDEADLELIGAWDDEEAVIKPVGGIVIGVESSEMRKFQATVNLKKVAADKAGKPLDQEEIGIETVCKMWKRFVNFTDGGKPLKAPEDNERFFRASDNFVGQVYNFGRKSASFLKGSSDEPS